MAACGGNGNHNPDANPGIDASLGVDAAMPDATPSFGLTSIFPAAASRMANTPLTIQAFGVTGTPAIRLTNCDQPTTTYDLTPGTITSSSLVTALAIDPTRVQGAYTVTVTNGDGMVASLTCALHVLGEPPPLVNQVVPSTAWQGVPADNVNSDVTVTITGTGFLSTPSVRWVSRTNPAVFFDAASVGFVSETRITAVVPSETQSMPVGTYDVFVTNPDQLNAQWKNGAVPGDFTITGTAPPKVADVSPARIQSGTCASTSMTISGTNFAAGATAWYLAPAGTSCGISTTDASNNLLCPMTVGTITATTITAQFPACPALGPYPVVVINPDRQSSYWFSIEVTPSSDGHLNVGAFEAVASHLETARWKHAAQYGFDVFSDALMYVAGGQDAANNVLGSVEASQFDLFGTPGPFHHLEQFGGAASPRVPNNLTVPREGSMLVRAGGSLFSIGGTTMRSDTTAVVAASNVVERAEILGFGQMPVMMQPAAQAQTRGLPMGSWYYRVSAVGPWGESLGSREVVALSKSGQIQVCWQPPTAAGTTSYNIYRSLASDGRLGTATAIAYEVSAADHCWLDTGVGPSAPAPGNTRGTLAAGGTLTAGPYTYRVSAVVPLPGGGTRETYAGYSSRTTIADADVIAGNQTIKVAWDAVPITGTVYRVYRLDQATGTFKLLLGADQLAATSFVDSNVGFVAGGVTP
ncbi:MAG TPA: IPT/TIG domain-containing protein, partial [Kofleriaceae bacterium]|nr:IPT/TIG domain-containing protein [Kofleriaceae bacterium]